MAIDAKNIGAFGVSFSRGMDQSWVNMWRKDDGFLVEFFQNFEDMDSDEDDEIISENSKISIVLGEEIIACAFSDAQLDQWQAQYGAADEGAATDLNWTIDVDDNAGADLLLLSGNRKLPPNDWMSAVVQAVRLGEDRFMRCVREFR